MRTEDLIRDLVQAGRPVRPLLHPLIRLAVWVVLTAGVMALGVALLGAGPQLASIKVQPNPLYPLLGALAVILGVSSATVVLVYCVPGQRSRWLLLAPLVAFAIWMGVIVYATATAPYTGTGDGAKCIRNIAVLSVIPAVLLYAALRVAAPSRAGFTGFLAMLGVGAFSCGATSLICQQRGPAHFFMWHFLPVLVLGGAGALAGAWIFRKKI